MKIIARIIFFALLPIFLILVLLINITMFTAMVFIKLFLQPLEGIAKTSLELPKWMTWWEN